MGGLALAVLACAPAPGEPPVALELEVAVRPAAPAGVLLARWNALDGGRQFRADGSGVVWVELPLPDAGWRAGDRPGRFRCALPEPIEDPRRLPARLEVIVGAVRIPVDDAPGAAATLAGRTLQVDLDPGATAPVGARLAAAFERGPPGRCVLRTAAFERGEGGLVLWPGERLELACAAPPGAVLRFTPRAQPMLAPADVVFRVWSDGVLVVEERVRAGAPEQRVEVPLPPVPAGVARLAFEVAGDPAATAFARPALASVATGSQRPDVVLFVADTFRADLLAAWGAEEPVAPNLDALSARGVRFLAARSTSTWTLPAHASIFTGLMPPQHGAERRIHALAPGIGTLAERFAAAGYRTAAVTDGVFLSDAHGLDRGFESFLVHPRGHWSLRETLRQADTLLDEDDGRPLFLFVHSYRMHWPYRTGVEEDDRAARALRARSGRMVRTGMVSAAEDFASVVAELHDLYRDGARALDAALGAWTAGLERRGLLSNGLFVFTSDHGEEFLEHGGVLHDGDAHEELVRVPLFLVGAGLAPRDVTLGASLVDLAPTLAGFAGIEPDPVWYGRDLLALDEERLLFACARRGRAKGRVLAATHGTQKIHAGAIPEVELPRDLSAAYDLAADPLERHDLSAGASWPAELARRAGAEWAALCRPLASAPELVLDPAQLDELAELGYGE